MGRWHCWQLRCRIGAMSLEKVIDSLVCARAEYGIALAIAAATPAIAAASTHSCVLAMARV